MITAGIWVIIASLVVITAALALRLTRDTGTHAAPRPGRGDWPAPDPAEWLPAPSPVPEVAHEEDWQAVADERHSGVIVADVYTPSEWREPFAAWESDTFVGGMLAITSGEK